MATNASILAAFERMWQHISVALSQKTDIDHLHDDRYYTEGEIDTKVAELNEAIANASSQPDWNQNDATSKDYIHNKPFYENVTGSLDTLTWDGNIDGLECLSGAYYHVSNIYPSLSDIQYGCTASVSIGGSDNYNLIVTDMSDDHGFEAYALALEGCPPSVLCFSQSFEYEGVMNPAGIYFTNDPTWYTTSLTINNYTGFGEIEIQTLDEKFIPDTIARKTDIGADWEQKDELALDFIKNKPFGEIITRGDTITWDGNIEGRTCVLLDIPDNNSKAGWCLMSDYVLTPDDFTEGFKDTYFFMGSERVGVISNQEDMGHHFLNDGVFWTGSGRTICVPYDNCEFEGILYPNKGIYFQFMIYNGELLDYGSSLTIPGFDFADATIKTIDEKYLPDTIAHIEYVDAQLLEKMDSVNPTGTGSLSLNRKPETTIGINSVAVGSYTTASGDNSYAGGILTVASGAYSHAEGQNTTASITNAHAEGYYTTASGHASHAEGSYSDATNDSAHAEGYSTTASGVRGSHAEGEDTKATNEASHAEGYWTEANGAYSHSEGCYSKAGGEAAHAEGRSETKNRYTHAEGYFTVASSQYQHVQGKYNVEDASNTYAHIVGNGAGTGDRSNAHTIDWDGNAWFSGDVYVGSTSGTNKDEGSKKLVTTDDVYTKAEVDALIAEVIDSITKIQMVTWEAND